MRNSDSTADAQQISDRLAETLGSLLNQDAAVDAIVPLKGGAIQENWRLVAQVDGDRRDFVVRKDAPAVIGASHSRKVEFEIMTAAHRAGVRVPEPIGYCSDPTILGGPFAVFGFVEGQSFGPRIVRLPEVATHGTAIARSLGEQLARIHAIEPGNDGLDALGSPAREPALAEVDLCRAALDRLGLVRPALEWGLRWAEVHAPPPARIRLCHRDFRTGNYMVHGGSLAVILDWEFAGWSDPVSDIGWFCAQCWRFGQNHLAAGGIARRETFYESYETAAGVEIDRDAVAYWELFAHLRWAVIALQQAARHASGAEPSLELALTGRIVPELELHVLRETAPIAWAPHDRVSCHAG